MIVARKFLLGADTTGFNELITIMSDASPYAAESCEIDRLCGDLVWEEGF